MAEEKKKLIQFKNIVKSFEDGQVVLKGVSLDIYENEFVTLLGPSGCGKTTLLRILGGFLQPSEGKVLFDGEDIVSVPPYKREINTVFQKYALFPHMDVYDNIAFGLTLKKEPKDVIEQKVMRMLRLVSVMLEDDLVMFEDKKYACRARGYNKNEKVDVVIRPEHLDIVPRAEGMLKGTVKSQLFKGMHYETVVETRVGTSITVKMQVSQDRPVYNEEKGEKISANAFLLDVEDVEELDDAKVVALASAEAWDAETEEPISIKTVEYDIKPETGNYTVTFATANDTSITVKVLVVAQNRVESKVYQEEIYAMNFFKKVEDIQESIALDTDLETWASASAWSLEDGEQVEITDVKYDFDPETITPGVYDVTFSTEGYEYKVSTTHAFEEGEQVGLVFRPEDIHVMKKEGQW